MRNTRIVFWGKVLCLQVFFLLLHYLYEWFPGSVSAFFSATDESVYQHMKVAFFAYCSMSVLEYLLLKKSITNLSRFVHSRLLCAVLMPLLVIAWYFTSAAYFVKIASIFLEILFANIAMILTSVSTLLIESHVEKAAFNRGLKAISVSLFIVILSEFVIFNYRLPWIDVFANPPGW